jgi:hypothetical protein
MDAPEPKIVYVEKRGPTSFEQCSNCFCGWPILILFVLWLLSQCGGGK